MVDPGSGTELPGPFGGFALPGALAGVGAQLRNADSRETRPGAHFAPGVRIGAIALPIPRSGLAGPLGGAGFLPETRGGSGACPMVAPPAGSQQSRPAAHSCSGNLGSAEHGAGRYRLPLSFRSRARALLHR